MNTVTTVVATAASLKAIKVVCKKLEINERLTDKFENGTPILNRNRKK